MLLRGTDTDTNGDALFRRGIAPFVDGDDREAVLSRKADGGTVEINAIRGIEPEERAVGGRFGQHTAHRIALGIAHAHLTPITHMFANAADGRTFGYDGCGIRRGEQVKLAEKRMPALTDTKGEGGMGNCLARRDKGKALQITTRDSLPYTDVLAEREVEK